jgi:uncharacterized cupredoxin-like copper-binding protein
LGVLSAAALAACGGAASGNLPSTSPTTPGEQVKVALTDFAITPAQVTLHGGEVVFQVANKGRTPHNLSLRDGSGAVVAHTRDLDPGQFTTMTLHLETETYSTFCSLPGHASLGMRGTVTVDG